MARYTEHYHRWSLSESTVATIKAKFGEAIRCKGDVSQIHELLCKGAVPQHLLRYPKCL